MAPGIDLPRPEGSRRPPPPGCPVLSSPLPTDFVSLPLPCSPPYLSSLPQAGGDRRRRRRSLEQASERAHAHVRSGARGWPGSPAHGKGGNQRRASRRHRGTCSLRRVVYSIEWKRGGYGRGRGSDAADRAAARGNEDGEHGNVRPRAPRGGGRGKLFPPFKNHPEILL